MSATPSESRSARQLGRSSRATEESCSAKGRRDRRPTASTPTAPPRTSSSRSGTCSGANFALAAFNVSDGDVTDKVDFGCIPGLSDKAGYVAYEYFTKTFIRVSCYEDIDVTLPRDGVAVWSIYPILRDGDDEEEYILLGDTEKYVPIASEYKVKKLVSELPL